MGIGGLGAGGTNIVMEDVWDDEVGGEHPSNQERKPNPCALGDERNQRLLVFKMRRKNMSQDTERDQ